MLTAAAALVIWIAALVTPDGDVQYGAFDSEARCQEAVASVRNRGMLATDCVRTELPQPKRVSL